jgi:hypothetical protein
MLGDGIMVGISVNIFGMILQRHEKLYLLFMEIDHEIRIEQHILSFGLE